MRLFRTAAQQRCAGTVCTCSMVALAELTSAASMRTSAAVLKAIKLHCVSVIDIRLSYADASRATKTSDGADTAALKLLQRRNGAYAAQATLTYLLYCTSASSNGAGRWSSSKADVIRVCCLKRSSFQIPLNMVRCIHESSCLHFIIKHRDHIVPSVVCRVHRHGYKS